MIFKSHVFDEPMLEFGDGGQHCDPRQGLREFGPLQPRSGDVVRVGVIGTEDTVGGFTEFLAQTARGIDSENKQLINLNPDFPALGNQNPFRCKFEVPDGATATLSRRQINEIRGIGGHDNAVRHAVELIASQLSVLTESSAKPDVIVLALPVPLIEKLVNAKSEEQLEGAEADDYSDGTLNFRDLLKANTLHLDVPTQIVWPDTWDDAAEIPQKVKRQSNRQTQVKATRASTRSFTSQVKCRGVFCPIRPNTGRAFSESASIVTSTDNNCGQAPRRCSTNAAEVSFCAAHVRRRKPRVAIRISRQRMRRSWLCNQSRPTRPTIGTCQRVSSS
jgi:hypothetical protein